LAISSEFVGRRFIGGFGDLTNSSDVMWGCKLVALRAEPLAITNDLPSRVEASVGNSLLLLEVGLRGGPASYRWYKNGSVIIDLAFSEPLKFFMPALGNISSVQSAENSPELVSSRCPVLVSITLRGRILLTGAIA